MMTPDFTPLAVLAVIGAVAFVAIVAFGPWVALVGLEYLLSPRTGQWPSWLNIAAGGWAFLVIFGAAWTVWGPL